MNVIFFGSLFPIHLKPNFYLWGRKRQLYRRFFQYQLVVIKFHNLKIIWTPGSNFTFHDIFSQNATLSEASRLQLQHKEIPHDISSSDQDRHKMHFTIKLEDDENASNKDLYPIICQNGNTRRTLRLKNDGIEHHVDDNHEDN